MKTFAINLKRETIKRKHIINECDKYSIDVEIIDAINGKNLSEEYLKSTVYNYSTCKLTKGEIGCALSHISIYQKMVNENISVCLIIEDDAIFVNDPRPLISQIEKQIKSDDKNVYLLSGCLGTYFVNSTLDIGSYRFYKAYESFLTHGYIINLKAAKAILALQTPLKFEADKWYSFELFNCVNTYCLLPLLIDNNDKTKKYSSLEKDRSDIIRGKERHRQMIKIYKNHFKVYLKRKLFKLKAKMMKTEIRSDGLEQ